MGVSGVGVHGRWAILAQSLFVRQRRRGRKGDLHRTSDI